jgi:hypothetical protein
MSVSRGEASLVVLTRCLNHSKSRAHFLHLPVRPDEHPLLVYLNRLSPGSRRAMGQALRAVVAAYTRREVGAATDDEILSFPWARIGFQHVQKVRAALAEKYSPASANRMLSALRSVLHAAFRLGQNEC